jgi:protein involved in polysaccharide export with SLBB domain
MTLRDAVLIAGGLEESALLSEAEVARMPESRAGGAKAVAIRVPIDSSYLFERTADGRYIGPPGMPGRAGSVPEVVLQPYDNVLIYRQTDWSLPQSVVITGEVRRPGRYTLRSKNERLSDVVARAGGVTPEANADGIVFVRDDRDMGRIGIDLRSVLRNPKHRDNLLLVDGDSIAVPVFTAVINVRGKVNSPSAVTYVPGASLQYYIDAAGGTAPDGDSKRAFVTQPNGKIEARRDRGIFPDAMPLPRAGGVVFVPEKSAATIGSSFASIATTAVQIIGSIVTLYLLIDQAQGNK